MAQIPLSLIMDVLILILLGVTIFYAARLSLYLKRFRDSKSELEGIISELSKHITKADNAIKTLNETVEISGDDLQSRMNSAHAMYDELEMIVQTADSLASRLEKLAVSKKQNVTDFDEENSRRLKTDKTYDDRLQGLVRHVDEMGGVLDNLEKSPFSIRDHDVERGEDAVTFTELNDEEVEFLSDAERDLYNTLNKKTAKKGG